MKKNSDLVTSFPGIIIIHQKIPGKVKGEHQHGEHEFFLPLQGEISVSTADHTAKAGPGHMLYVPPDIIHSFTSSAQGAGERIICLIDQKIWKKQFTKGFPPTGMRVNPLAKELIFYLLLHKEAKGVNFFIAALIEALGESLESACLESQRLSLVHLEGSVKDPRITKAISLIDKNLGDISLVEVAKQSGLSTRNFNRLFVMQTGIGPKDFMINCKMDKAKRLLKETGMTVTDISLEVGYSSFSKFIETFKRTQGILPSDFRDGK